MLSRLILLAGLVLAAGCQQNKQKVIAVIPKATSHIFWLSVQQGAYAAGRELGVTVEWNGPTVETDYSRQIQIMDSALARRVDGIAVAAAERKALLGPLERAAAGNVPVTVFDSGVDSTNYSSYVATDNVEGGRMAARTLAGLLGGKGSVALLEHAPGSASTMDREKGFREVLAREFPEIRIVAAQFSMSDRSKAMAAAENFLTAHPNLNGIFASAEPGSVGASLALKARGLSGKVKLVGFDSSESLIQDLRGGTLDALVVQDPYRMGYEAVRTLVDRLNGKTPPKQLDLQARVIVKADLEKPEVRRLLMMK